MKRLTTDTPNGNFETMCNFVFGKDGWAHINFDGEESVPLTQWAKAQCILRGCTEFPAGTPQEIDEEICDCMMDALDCPIALAYTFAAQACHLRSRLKLYEDILFARDGTERLSLDDLRRFAIPNDPLTIEELRKMDGEPVYVVLDPKSHPGEPSGWKVIKKMDDDFIWFADGTVYSLYYLNFLRKWFAFRRRPEGV